MEEDGRLQDVYIRTPELVLMARRVDSAAPFGKVVDVRFRFGISIFWREMYGNFWLINWIFFPCPGF